MFIESVGVMQRKTYIIISEVPDHNTELDGVTNVDEKLGKYLKR